MINKSSAMKTFLVETIPPLNTRIILLPDSNTMPSSPINFLLSHDFFLPWNKKFFLGMSIHCLQMLQSGMEILRKKKKKKTNYGQDRQKLCLHENII